MKYIFFLLPLFVLTSCSKENLVEIRNTNQEVHYPVEFPSNNNSYWKLYYKDPQGLISHVKEEHDSIYFSNESVTLNIVEGNDTTPKNYKILKVVQKFMYYDSVGWFIYPEKNYGLYRVDSIQNRILSVRTTNFNTGGPPYPTDRYFIEFELINYNLKSGDLTDIPKINSTSAGTASVAQLNINSHNIIKQDIINQDTLASRIQFGCVKNTAKYAKAAIDNTIQLAPIWLYKYVYYYSPQDSIEINYDTDLFY